MPKLLFPALVVLLCGWLPLQAQETLSNIDSALAVLKSAPRDTAQVIRYQQIGGHYNVTQLDSAPAFFRKGWQLSQAIQYRKGEWMNLNGLGNYHERKTQYDSAMFYYDKALKIVEETESTKGFAIILNNIATIHIRKGDYETALQFLFDALKAEEALENQNGIAQAYNNIGVVYYYTQDFDKTTFYLTQALEIQEELGTYDGLINGYNNIGAIYIYQEKYDPAIAAYQKGLDIAKKIGDRKMEATQLSNMALAFSNKKDFVQAERIFNEAVALRKEIEDYNGWAHSYQAFGQMYLQQQNFPKAKYYLDEALAIARDKGIKMIEKESLAVLVEYAEAQKDYQGANAYLYEYLAVKDALLNEEKTKAIAEMETKYETEKKERDLAETRAFLAEKELEVKQKNTLMYGGFGLALVLGLLGYLFYNQQKLKNRQLQKEGELKTALARIETQNKLQEQRLRISRDLHDNIGSQLTFIISSLDNLKYGFPDLQEKLSEKLSGISEFATQTIYELRDTIWAMNKNDITFEDLQARITNFINQAKVAASETAFEFYTDPSVNQEHKFTSIQGMNIYRIIQEAVNNAIKYATASKVEVAVHEVQDSFYMTIQDHGNGFDKNEVTMGNGLNNMAKRARDLEGELTIDSEKGKGTTLRLRIPKNS